MARKSDNRAAGLLVAGIVGALIAGALALSSNLEVDSTLDDAAVLHAADMAVSTLDLTMSSIGNVVLVSQDAASGTASQDDVAAAGAEAGANMARVNDAFTSLPDSTRVSLAFEYSAWESAAAPVLDLADQGEPVLAAAMLGDSLAPAADALAEGLLDERDNRAAAVADADGNLGFAGRLAGFLVVFVLPLAAILIYRESARRQLKAASAHLDARIDAEATTGRNRDEVVSAFASQLQVPLASIQEFADLLVDGKSNPDRVSDLAGLINSRAAGLSNRVEDVLAAAESLSPVATRTLAISDQVDVAITAFVAQGHEIGGTYGSGSVRADPARVQQILRNLLSNAIDHGGSKVSVFGDEAGSRYVIAVEDNGDGLPDDVVAEFANEVAPLESAAGLGIAVSRLLAMSMGGSLEYDRIAGRTAFILSLPLADQDIESPAPGDMLIATEQ